MRHFKPVPCPPEDGELLTLCGSRELLVSTPFMSSVTCEQCLLLMRLCVVNGVETTQQNVVELLAQIERGER